MLTLGFGAIVVVALIVRLIRRLLSGKRMNAKGYVIRKSKSGRPRYEHRELAEQVLGRRLEKWEVVHHINGRRADNRLENLCVMDHRDHDRYHDWYNWIYKTYGNYPRRETQLQKLREDFKGELLLDYLNERTGSD